MNSGQKDNPALGLFLGILFWYAIAFYIFGLAKLVPERLPYPFVSGIALISSVYWTGFLAVSLWRRWSVWVGSWQACEHGVRGGKKRRRCLRCRQHEDFRRQEAESHLAEHLLRIEFSKRAGDLAHAQYLRRAELTTRSVAMRDLEIARLKNSYVPKIDELRAIGSKRFEDAMAAMFQRLGYQVEQTPYTNDYGRDAILFRDGMKFLLECKCYAEDALSGREDLQKFHSAIVTDKAVAGFFVTTGRATKGAIEFSDRASIQIISGDSLLQSYLKSMGGVSAPPTYTALCRECGETVTHSLGSSSEVKCSQGHLVAPTISLEDFSTSNPQRETKPQRGTATPICRNCSSAMRLVKGKRGKFWGCSRFPDCRSTLPYQ